MGILSAFDHCGNAVKLMETGKGGGEGNLYWISGRESDCAKVYHPEKITQELQSKIAAMVRSAPEDPTWTAKHHHSIAWPSAALYREKNSKNFIGFVMPKIDTEFFQESHRYYDASDRVRFAPGFTWKHLWVSAHNMASAIAALHTRGHRVGDLRETNVLVAPTSLISLVDCDSFQVKDCASEEIYYSRVGTGEYLPPELIGVDFRGKNYDRYYSDLFALAVMVFKFLMHGVHPYQARGRLVEDSPTPEAKIKKGYFPYDGVRGVEPPDYALPYEIIPPGLQGLFKRCFVEGHNDPHKRPVALAWLGALHEGMSGLRTCEAVRTHTYGGHLNSCPWCVMAGKTGRDLYPEAMEPGEQIELDKPESVKQSLSEREAYLRALIQVALADGVLKKEEEDYVTKVGIKLQIPQKEIGRVIQEERKKIIGSHGAIPPPRNMPKFPFHTIGRFLFAPGAGVKGLDVFPVTISGLILGLIMADRIVKITGVKLGIASDSTFMALLAAATYGVGIFLLTWKPGIFSATWNAQNVAQHSGMIYGLCTVPLVLISYYFFPFACIIVASCVFWTGILFTAVGSLRPGPGANPNIVSLIIWSLALILLRVALSFF